MSQKLRIMKKIENPSQRLRDMLKDFRGNVEV